MHRVVTINICLGWSNTDQTVSYVNRGLRHRHVGYSNLEYINTNQHASCVNWDAQKHCSHPTYTVYSILPTRYMQTAFLTFYDTRCYRATHQAVTVSFHTVYLNESTFLKWNLDDWFKHNFIFTMTYCCRYFPGSDPSMRPAVLCAQSHARPANFCPVPVAVYYSSWDAIDPRVPHTLNLIIVLGWPHPWSTDCRMTDSSKRMWHV